MHFSHWQSLILVYSLDTYLPPVPAAKPALLVTLCNWLAHYHIFLLCTHIIPNVPNYVHPRKIHKFTQGDYITTATSRIGKSANKTKFKVNKALKTLPNPWTFAPQSHQIYQQYATSSCSKTCFSCYTLSAWTMALIHSMTWWSATRAHSVLDWSNQDAPQSAK